MANDQEKKKNSFRDMILIVFVVLVCFGLTVYGIVYLTGKVFSGEEKIEIAKIKPQEALTDPEEGDILTFSSEPRNEGQPYDAAKVPAAEPAEPETFKPTLPKGTPSVSVKKETPEKALPESSGFPKTENSGTALKNNVPAKEKVSTPPKTASSKKGRYAVQILAVKTKEAADKEAAKYRREKPDVFVQKADLGNKGVWYRVRCCVTDSKDEAERSKNRLAIQFKIKPDVVLNK